MVMARCKFSVISVEPFPYNAGEQHIKFDTEYDPEDPEDTKFSQATPWGNLEFALSNPNLVGKFKVGDVFYVDLTPVE